MNETQYNQVLEACKGKPIHPGRYGVWKLDYVWSAYDGFVCPLGAFLCGKLAVSDVDSAPASAAAILDCHVDDIANFTRGFDLNIGHEPWSLAGVRMRKDLGV